MPSTKTRSRGVTREALPARAGRVALSGLFVLGMALPAMARAVPAAAQASTVSFSTAEVAPADSISYIVTTLDDRSEQWRLADTLLDRAGFGEAIDQALAQEMTDESGEALPLDAFLGGEVAIVLSQVALETLTAESVGAADMGMMMGDLGEATPEPDSTGPKAQGFAVVLDARAPSTAWAGIRESAQAGDNEELTYEGTTIFYTPPASDEEDGMAAAQVGDHILIATAPDDLHPLIDTADGRTPDITTLPEFTSAREALPAEFLTFGFATSLADAEIDLGPFGAATEGLITDTFSAMTLAADEPGFRLETVTLPRDGETLPAGPAPYDSSLVEAAPDDAIFFMSSPDLGATGVLDALGAVALGLAFGMGDPSMTDPSATPPAGTPEDTIAAQYEDAAALIGVNLQTDLFQQLVGEYGGWVSADAAGGNVSGLFASAVSDPAVVENTLMQLSFLIQGASGGESALTTRDVAGGQVYVVELGDEAGSTLEFGVVDDQLVIGSGDAVDRLGGTSSGSLAENAQYQAVMDTLPVEGSGSLYVDLVQLLPLLEATSEESGGFGLDGMGEITDASETCANYATQEEAQAAYDAGEPDTFDLDQDFDGEVCEDFFASADATAVEDNASGGNIEATLTDVDYSALTAFALVSHEEEGLPRTSSILYISE